MHIVQATDTRKVDKESEEILKTEKKGAIRALIEIILGVVLFEVGFVLIGIYQSVYGVIAMALTVVLVIHAMAVPYLE